MTASITNQKLIQLHHAHAAYMCANNRERGFDMAQVSTLYGVYADICHEIGICPATIGDKLSWWAHQHYEYLTETVAGAADAAEEKYESGIHALAGDRPCR